MQGILTANERVSVIAIIAVIIAVAKCFDEAQTGAASYDARKHDTQPLQPGADYKNIERREGGSLLTRRTASMSRSTGSAPCQEGRGFPWDPRHPHCDELRALTASRFGFWMSKRTLIGQLEQRTSHEPFGITSEPLVSDYPCSRVGVPSSLQAFNVRHAFQGVMLRPRAGMSGY